MNKEEILWRLEDLIENDRVTFGYNPKGDEDWFISIDKLKRLINDASGKE